MSCCRRSSWRRRGLKLFLPEALLMRMQQRLKLLVGGARDLPARQQTPRAMPLEHALVFAPDEPSAGPVDGDAQSP